MRVLFPGETRKVTSAMSHLKQEVFLSVNLPGDSEYLISLCPSTERVLTTWTTATVVLLQSSDYQKSFHLWPVIWPVHSVLLFQATQQDESVQQDVGCLQTSTLCTTHALPLCPDRLSQTCAFGIPPHWLLLLFNSATPKQRHPSELFSHHCTGLHFRWP